MFTRTVTASINYMKKPGKGLTLSPKFYNIVTSLEVINPKPPKELYIVKYNM